ncbi:hypothetical protein GCM10027360_07290 [Amycolatopsis echigonensis]|nr:hypothetical protein GCM10017788_50360 [Amycolatopsis acidiphila]
MGGSDVGGSYATPDRVIPRFGQPAEYTVEAAVFPSEGGDVLHDDEAWSQYANGVQDAAPQSTASAFLDTRAPTGGGNVLTRKPRREHLDRCDGGEVDRT